jgi:hypothetical protein
MLTDIQKLALSKVVIPDLKEAREALTPGDHTVTIEGLNIEMTVRIGEDGRRRIVNKIDWTSCFLKAHERLNLLEKAAGETETSLVDLVADAMTEKPTLSKEAKKAAQDKVDSLKDETWTDCKGAVTIKECSYHLPE